MPEDAFCGQGYLRKTLATDPRIKLRSLTTLTLWVAALVTDAFNQIQPFAISMPTTEFWVTIGLVAVALIITAVVYPRLSSEHFFVLEQSMLAYAGLLILYQCSATGWASSPYLFWFLLTSFYAAYLLPRGQATANLLGFTAAIVAIGLAHESPLTTITLMQLVALVVTIWVVGLTLMRHRYREDTLERAVKFLALADPLTSTANMRSFERYLDQLVRTDGQRFAVLVADMDGLKGANAVFGYEAGDGMIVRMGRLMLRASSERDQVARFGGDEFAVVIPGGSSGDVTRWIKEFEREVQRHNAEIRGKLPQISVSIGSALYPDDSVRGSELIDIADRRMYAQKDLAVAPPHEPSEIKTPPAGRTFRAARFSKLPRHSVDLRDWLAHAAINWLAIALLTLATATSAALLVHRTWAIACGLIALTCAATAAFQLRRGAWPTTLQVLDALTIILPFPLIWATGGSLSPLLIAMALPISYYAQHLKQRVAFPRIALVLAGTTAGFMIDGPHGDLELTRFLTSIAVMLAVASVLQYSAKQQTESLGLLRSSASLDHLTGLPNIYALRNELDLRQRAGSPTAVLLFDLDNYRQTNTIAGHRGGDSVLQSVASRLVEASPESSVYRVGGDEFALLTDRTANDQLRELSERCLAAIAHDHRLGERSLRVTASAGTAVWESDIDPDRLLDEAEQSLSANKVRRTGPEDTPRRILL